MDMLPEEDREPSEPADDAPETQPPEVSAAPAPSEPAAPPEQRHPSSDEALAEMRRTLREEEGREKTGFVASVSRLIGKVFRRKKPEAEELTEAPSRLDGLLIPPTPSSLQSTGTAEATREFPAAAEAPQEGAQAAEEAPAETGAAGEFRSLVRKKISGALPGLGKMEPLVPPPEPSSQEAALEFLNPKAAEAREEPEGEPSAQSILTSLRQGEEEVTEEPAEIREAALEGYVTEPEEAEEGLALGRRMQRGWRDMRPVERRMLVGVLAIVALAFVAGSGFLVYQSRPTPTPAMTPTLSILPVPISLSLPGGWVFPLRTGQVQNGKWDPTSAEWLQGTEVCRWVSLPWTIQLEAVVRTLKADDQIQLSMSNYDALIYKVRSIQQVPPSDIQQLATDTPCLLVILTNKDSDTRWVVTAKP